MLNRSFILELKQDGDYIRWTLMTKHGRVDAVGVSKSERQARLAAMRHLPRRARITTIRESSEQ